MPAGQQTGGELFDRVVATLRKGFHDRTFAAESLPGIAARYRGAAQAAASLDEERSVIHAMLGEVPSSHTALYSQATWHHLEAELFGRATPTFGCQLVDLGGRFFVDAVLDGGPAEHAGLHRGEQVVAIDGVPPGGSPRLDWRSDDAFLPDPPVHLLLAAAAGERMAVRVADAAGNARTVVVVAAKYSALAASKNSVSVIERDGRQVGYLHLWMVFNGGAADLISKALADFSAAGCAGVVLDLRGRGGSAMEVFEILGAIERWRRTHGEPLLALVDGRTRSAKEVLASELQRRRLGRICGERTAGAVVPATFTELGDGGVLMYPAGSLGKYSDRLEGKGVTPDIAVADRFAYAGDRDPILLAGVAACDVAAPARH